MSEAAVTSPIPVRRGLRARRFLAWATLAVVVALLLSPIPPGTLGVWQERLLDSGHVPLFAALILALYIGYGSLRWALVFTLVVAGLAEVVQPFFGRAGDWIDLLRGSLGAFCATAVIRAYEVWRSPVRVAVYMLLAFAFALWPAIEIAPYIADTVEGRRAFPVIAGFTTNHEMRRWQCQQATFTRTEGGARLEFFPGANDFSYAAMRPAVADWSRYRWVNCEFRALEPLEMVISVRTRSSEPNRTTHSQVGRIYTTGEHTIRLDLHALREKGRRGPLDLTDVRYYQLFVYRIKQPTTVVVSRIWLEP